MAKTTHRIRARMRGGAAEIKLLLQHPMETGNRRDPVTNIKVPRHFIREVRCEHKGIEVLSCDWSWGVSRNPFLSFRVTGAQPGDAITVTWSDSEGVSDSIETPIE